MVYSSANRSRVLSSKSHLASPANGYSRTVRARASLTKFSTFSASASPPGRSSLNMDFAESLVSSVTASAARRTWCAFWSNAMVSIVSLYGRKKSLRSFAEPYAKQRDISREPDLVNARFFSRSTLSASSPSFVVGSGLRCSKKSFACSVPGSQTKKYCNIASWSVVKPVCFFWMSELIWFSR
jgi:hypothetical protein